MVKLKKTISILDEKYKKAKIQLEKARGANKQMKEKVRRSTSSGVNVNRFRSSHSRRPKPESTRHMLEIKRLESHVERLKADLRFFQTQNEDMKMSMQKMQRSSESRNLNKRYEAEKSKNMYLENENMQLQKQIRELNAKYKLYIDDRNRQTVGDFMSRKSVNSREVEEIRVANSNLRKENRDMREKMLTMNNELKMKSNISDAVSKKELELGQLRNGLSSLREENDFLRQKIMQLEMENASMKEELRVKSLELQKIGTGNDHMVKMYQRLYNDMNQRCEIYMDKVRQLSAKLQASNREGHLTYTKNVYQSRRKLQMATWWSTCTEWTTSTRGSSPKSTASCARTMPAGSRGRGRGRGTPRDTLSRRTRATRRRRKCRTSRRFPTRAAR